MSTLKTTYIQHPSATGPAIELTAAGTVALPLSGIGDLVDVDEGSGAADGDVLTYDGSSNLWLPQAGLAGIGSNVVQTVKTDTFSTSSGTFVDVTGVSLTITPTSATSKIMVLVNGITSSNGAQANRFRLVRDATDIALAVGGTAQETQRIFPGGANYTGAISISFLDSPATTSATVYKLTMSVSGGTGYVGRLAGFDERSITSITAIEVAA